ncbi:hypothetical protein TrCOL_g4532 [Triparma columacea]|uniref:Serine--tRNA ligase n=1 Tax=Triparma columacea TaxID=722753 RepID=A0A9W7GCR5_9STRA|nr:hypothetical protein TrCOL_g4532 [Triparma columacea]
MREGTELEDTCGYSNPATIAKNLDLITSHCVARSSSSSLLDSLSSISTLASSRVSLIQERDNFLSLRKKLSAEVGKAMKVGEKDRGDTLKAEAASAGESADEASKKLEEVDDIINGLTPTIPNLLNDQVPPGKSEDDNVVVSTWGDVEALPKELGWGPSFTPLWHDDVALSLNGWESTRAVRMSGSRFVALSGAVAQLERALGQFFLDLALARGYTEVSVPTVVSRSALEGTGQLPKFEEDLFKVDGNTHKCNGEDAFLIPTAEVPLTNMLAGEILEEKELPVKYVALTNCYRAEAGSYGRDTRGLVRTHQFGKVELVKVTSPSQSAAEHLELVEDAEECLKQLNLPYRKVLLCAGDIGFGAEVCYDLEVWLPGQGEWREISSCSNTGDFQSRRMGLRYRGKQEGKKKAKPRLCHTMNGSGLAVGRALVAVLENYQCEDGTVRVPEVLRRYMGGKEVLGEGTKK